MKFENITEAIRTWKHHADDRYNKNYQDFQRPNSLLSADDLHTCHLCGKRKIDLDISYCASCGDKLKFFGVVLG